MNSRHPKTLEVVAHIVVWLLFFSWPFLFFSGMGQIPGEHIGHYFRYIIYPLMAMVLFYLNYCLLIKQVLFNGKNGQFVLLNLLLIALAVLLIHLWRTHLTDLLFEMPHRKPGRPGFDRSQWFFPLQNALNLLMVVVIAVLLRMVGRWRETEMQRQTLEKEKSLGELRILKSQLHPHFLFNTLNNIHALIAIDPDKAQTAVHDLGALLRYMLKEGELDETLLWDDVLFIRNYIDLMRLRLTSKTELEVKLPKEEDARACKLPPLLFINMVENAFKYGVGTQGGHIRISLEVDTEKKRVHFSCRNALPARNSVPLSRQDTGVGLQNLRKRLDYIYKNDYYFSAGPEGNEFVAELSVPVKSLTQKKEV